MKSSWNRISINCYLFHLIACIFEIFIIGLGYFSLTQRLYCPAFFGFSLIGLILQSPSTQSQTSLEIEGLIFQMYAFSCSLQVLPLKYTFSLFLYWLFSWQTIFDLFLAPNAICLCKHSRGFVGAHSHFFPPLPGRYCKENLLARQPQCCSS